MITTRLPLYDFAPKPADLLNECLAGLREEPKTLPCKFFYDRRGSELFDRICELPEYYPTRTELAIMHENIDAIAANLGPGCLVIELGSGSSMKTRDLLAAMDAPAAYMPVEISRQHLIESARRLATLFPELEILPVCADYMQPLTLPQPTMPIKRRVVYFPGSTIGNFHPQQARQFLHRIGQWVGPGGGLLIGVDLRKSPDILLPAYDDAAGVTAAFNLHLLERINQDAAGRFDLDRFEHRAVWNDQASRIEMHLVALSSHDVQVGSTVVHFDAGESIRTECSYKHRLADFAALAEPAFAVRRVWTDENELFSVQYLERR